MDWNTVWVPGVIAAGWVGLLYVVAPLVIWRKSRTQARLELDFTAFEHLDELAQQGIRAVVQELTSVGFRVVANYRNTQAIKRTVTVTVLFVNASTGDIAIGLYVRAEGATAPVESWTTEIESRCENGYAISTRSGGTPSVFPIDQSTDSINVPWVSDSRLLYSIHRARVQQWEHQSRRRIVPDAGKEADFLQSDYQNEMERVTRAGYFRLDSAASVYRMTLKGAFLMTWRMLWPMKQVRWRARDRRARQVLRELGFTELAAMPGRGAPSILTQRMTPNMPPVSRADCTQPTGQSEEDDLSV